VPLSLCRCTCCGSAAVSVCMTQHQLVSVVNWATTYRCTGHDPLLAAGGHDAGHVLPRPGRGHPRRPASETSLLSLELDTVCPDVGSRVLHRAPHTMIRPGVPSACPAHPATAAGTGGVHFLLKPLLMKRCARCRWGCARCWGGCGTTSLWPPSRCCTPRWAAGPPGRAASGCGGGRRPGRGARDRWGPIQSLQPSC
jgi:hypothetical protein